MVLSKFPRPARATVVGRKTIEKTILRAFRARTFSRRAAGGVKSRHFAVLPFKPDVPLTSHAGAPLQLHRRVGSGKPQASRQQP